MQTPQSLCIEKIRNHHFLLLKNLLKIKMIKDLEENLEEITTTLFLYSITNYILFQPNLTQTTQLFAPPNPNSTQNSPSPHSTAQPRTLGECS